MNTNDLIAVLAADTKARRSPEAQMMRALPPALAVSLVALITLWRVRVDLWQAWTSPTLIKTLLPLVLAMAALMLARSLCRPEDRARAETALVAALVGAVALAALWAVGSAGIAGTIAALQTPNLVTCLLSVPALAALPLTAAIWAMRSGAPVHPVRAGAVTGLVAGGAAAAIYSLHCPEDAVQYYLLAYSASILLVVAGGALAGRRYLRW